MWLICVSQIYRNHLPCFLGISATEDWKAQVWSLQARVQSATICFKRMVFKWEDLTSLTLAWAWKTHSLSIKGPGRFSLPDCGPVDDDSASCFVWPNTCHWSTGVVSVWGASFLVTTKETPSQTTTQVQLWPKTAQKLNSSGGRKKRSKQNTTKKIYRNTSDPTSTLAL